MKKSITPSFLTSLEENLKNSPQFVQVILGPRQVGKTTGIFQFLKQTKMKSLYFSADEILAPTTLWIEEKWQEAILQDQECLLVIDEIQKVPQWSSIIKKLWDEQKKRKDFKIQLVLLGSSSLQIQKGLTESLTGRFQLIRAVHWDFLRSQQLANMNIEQFITMGGYPGSYSLLGQGKSWERYIQDSIIEMVIGKDILNSSRIQKPALFRQAFEILRSYPAQEISYTKILGQIQDAGNTDLVKYYIELYEGAFLIKTLQKYSGRALVRRSSSPKIIPLCGALVHREIVNTKEGKERAFEAAVGACLLNHDFDVFYWRDGKFEVDFVTTYDGRLFAIEVKSGLKKSTAGLTEFQKKYKEAKAVFITRQNIEKFLLDPHRFFQAFL